MAYDVSRVTVGVTTLLVSASTGSRRTVKNIGSTTIEIVNGPASVAGTGYPLAPGEGAVFDGKSGDSGGLYAVSSAAGGVLAILVS